MLHILYHIYIIWYVKCKLRHVKLSTAPVRDLLQICAPAASQRTSSNNLSLMPLKAATVSSLEKSFSQVTYSMHIKTNLTLKHLDSHSVQTCALADAVD